MQTQPAMVPLDDTMLPSVLELIAAALPHSRVQEGRLRQLYSGPHASSTEATVALADGRAVGFVTAIYKTAPDGRPDSDAGYVTALAVDPDYERSSLGTDLLARAENYLKSRGLVRVLATAFPGFYFFPGIDVRYAFLTDLFTRAGFRVRGEPVDMKVTWEQYEPPSWLQEAETSVARQGLVIDHARQEHHAAFVNFMEKHFPGPWCERAKAHMASGEDLDRAVLVLDGKDVVGFVRFGASGDRGSIDSIGVRPDMRGKKLGSVLLARALQGMANRGATMGYFGYTGAIRFYETVGAQVIRRYYQFGKELA